MDRRAIACVVVCAGCYQHVAEKPCTIACTDTCPDGLTCVGGVCIGAGDSCGSAMPDAAAADAMPDGMLPPNDGPCTIYGGTGLFTYNQCPGDTGVLLQLAGAIDTSACVGPQREIVAYGSDSVCFVHAGTVDVTGLVTATGSRPLVIAGNILSIAAGITVSSSAGVNGAGAGFGCLNGASTPGLGAGGTGGPAGGRGGAGGSGTAGGAGAPAGFSITQITGGCPGSTGSTATAQTGGGGLGGGALYLVARTQIALSDNVALTAGGAHGLGGTSGGDGGGGGGGAGGLIAFDTPAIMFGSTASSVHVCAGGGGGGGGGNAPASGLNSGSPGGDGCGIGSGGGGAGGSAGGGTGGDGSATGDGAAGNPEGVAHAGGGGGGGGAGWIRVFGGVAAATLKLTTVTPAPQ